MLMLDAAAAEAIAILREGSPLQKAALERERRKRQGRR